MAILRQHPNNFGTRTKHHLLRIVKELCLPDCLEIREPCMWATSCVDIVFFAVLGTSGGRATLQELVMPSTSPASAPQTALTDLLYNIMVESPALQLLVSMRIDIQRSTGCSRCRAHFLWLGAGLFDYFSVLWSAVVGRAGERF